MSCPLRVFLSVAGVVFVIELLLIGVLAIVYKYRNKMHKVLLVFLTVLIGGLILVVALIGGGAAILASFTDYGGCFY